MITEHKKLIASAAVIIPVIVSLWSGLTSHYYRRSDMSELVIQSCDERMLIWLTVIDDMYKIRPALSAIAPMGRYEAVARLYRGYAVETDGRTATFYPLPAGSFGSGLSPLDGELFTSELSGDRGRLLRWSSGRFMPVADDQAVAIRSRMKPYITDQCKAEGWEYETIYNWEFDATQRVERVFSVRGHKLRLNLVLTPPSELRREGPPDQILNLSIESNGKRLLTQKLNYLQRTSGFSAEDWEAFRSTAELENRRKHGPD